MYVLSALRSNWLFFGVKDDLTTDKVLDLIMLMAKYYIFRCRCLKTIPNFTCFSKKVRQRAAIEKHAAGSDFTSSFKAALKTHLFNNYF